ncbi:baseplate hub assembly catalyst [Yersinia phage JC221]|nr:baseplate hub assembly catalyst [Yersinia phage JC221]
MIDVIRVKLPGGVKRFPMFTVKDYLSFLLTSADMEGKPPKEKLAMLDEILDILYPGYSKTEQEYIFTKVYCSSFGKNAIKIYMKSKNGTSEGFLHITDYELQNEYQIAENIVLGFNFPRKRHMEASDLLECMSYIIYDGTRHEWSGLDSFTKTNIMDLIEIDDIEKIMEMITKSCHIVVRENDFSNLLTLFTILFNKSDLNEFYKTNYLLNKNNIHIGSIMDASPMERSIYVALLAEELKRKAKENA